MSVKDALQRAVDLAGRQQVRDKVVKCNQRIISLVLTGKLCLPITCDHIHEVNVTRMFNRADVEWESQE